MKTPVFIVQRGSKLNSCFQKPATDGISPQKPAMAPHLTENYPVGIIQWISLSQLVFGVFILSVAFAEILGGKTSVCYLTGVIFFVTGVCGLMSSRVPCKGLLVSLVTMGVPCMILSVLFLYTVAWSELDSSGAWSTIHGNQLGCGMCELFLGMLMFMALTEGTLSLVLIFFVSRHMLFNYQGHFNEHKVIISRRMNWKRLLADGVHVPVQPAVPQFGVI